MKKKNFLFYLCMGFVLAASAAVVTGCKDKEKPPVDYGEEGMYYYTATDGEYWVILEEDTYKLWLGTELIEGTYSYDGTTFKMYKGSGEDAEAIPVAYADGELTITYNNGSYRFLEKLSYTVTYNVDGGSAIESTKVLNGKTLAKPADPVKAGYDFIGWYEDVEFKKPFAFNATPVTGDITLYARYVEDNYYGSEFKAKLIVDGQEIDMVETKNGVLYDIPTPNKQDAEFLGWYVSAYQDATKLTYKYTDQVLAENVKLFAMFKSATPVVSVYGNTIEWASTGATSYTVTVKNSNGTELYRNSGSATSATYDFTTQPEGEYIVTVTAGEQTATAYYKNKALARVSRFTILENSSIIFDGVDNATGYYITVDCGNDAHSHTSYYLSTSKYFNFANCEMQKGGIKFTVQAVANGYLPSVSETYVYSRDLAQVQNVRYDETNGKVVWDAVDGAMSYNVVIENGGNNYVYNVDTASVSVKNFSGDVKVTVTAVASGYNSGDKTTLEYTTQKLATPENLAVSGENISWSPVAGASKYNVTIGQYSYTTTATSYEIPVVLRTPGTFEVSVQAVGETEVTTSYYSDALTVNYKILKDVLYSNGKLTWSAVGGVSEYVITVNGKEQSKPEATATSAAITFTKAGENMIGFSAYDMSGKLIGQEIVKVNASKVTFDEQGGSAVKDVYLAVGDPFKFEESTNMGYDFAGWYNVPGGPKNNGAKYADGDVFQGGTTYVYAYWAPKAYTVTLIAEYDVDGDGTLETYETTETVYYMEHFEFDVPDLQGATFGGWYSERNSIGTLYTDSKGRSNDVWRTIGDSTAYAGWLNNVLAFELINNGTAYQVAQGTGIANVTEVTIPAVYNGKPVTTIAASAFLRSDLEVINIPDTVETIFVGQGGPYAAGSAFQYCYDLKEINVYCTDASHGDHSLYKPVFESEEGVLIKNDQEVGKQLYFFPKAKVGDYRVPDGVQLIPMRTFYDADDITTITIPASVTTIEKNAFYSASGVKNVIFESAPDGQEEKPLTIGEDAFYYCSLMTEISLPARLENMANESGRITQFTSCSKLANIKIVGSYEDAYYTSKDGFLFNDDTSRLLYSPIGKSGEITLPNGTEKVAPYAFTNCTKITKLNIPFFVEELEPYSFYMEPTSTSSKTSYSVLETIVFQGDADDDPLTIGDHAFYRCSELKDLVIGKNVATIGEFAFGATPTLRYVTVDSTVENPNYATNVFCYDPDIDSAELEGAVRSITIGENVDEFSVGGMFYGCYITKIAVVDGNDYYFAEDDVLFNQAKTKILYYPYGKTENYIIPNYVKIISDGVFANKSNITSVTIGANIEEIGAQAFAGCEYLTSVTFDQSRTTNLTIGASAFEGTKITEAIIPEKTVSIGDGAFRNCSELLTVGIPATATKIGAYEGESLVSMDVFGDCAKLVTLTVASANEAFSTTGGILYAKTNGVATDLCFVPKTATGTVEIPKTVVKLWTKAFYQNTGITAITFEDDTAAEGLDLGTYAFAEMTKLNSIDLPTGLTAIPEYTFYRSSVKTVTVPNTVTTVGKGAFTLSKVTSVTFEEGNEELPLTFENAKKDADGVFAGTENLKTITLPERTDGIASYMFAKTAKPSSGGSDDIIIRPRAILPRPVPGGESSDAIPGLRKLTIPSTVTKIYNDAFNGAENLGKCTQLRACTDKSTCTHGGLTFAANGDGDYSITEIQAYAFNKCTSLYKLEIPDTVTTIGKNASSSPSSRSIYGVFDSCTSLVSVKLPASLETVLSNSYDYYAIFDGCTALTEVIIPEGVKVLDTFMFKGCTALEEITIPSTVTQLPKGVFLNCAALTTVNLPDTLTAIGAYAFTGCTALTSIDVPNSVTTIGEYAFGGGKLLSTPYTASGLTSFTFPESVDKEGNPVDMLLGSLTEKKIFYGCENLTTVTISKAVKDISDLFAGCNSITTIVIKDGHQNLKLDDQNKLLVLNMDGTVIRSVLGGADTNGKFTIPAGVTEISDGAFQNATWLKSIEIPNTVTKIGNNAFRDCINLESVTFATDSRLSELGSYAFAATKISTITLPNTLKSLNGYTFNACASLTSITLPSGLEHIGSYEFKETALQSITLPDTLVIGASTDGGSNAFADCDGLTSVTLPASITYIPSYMFNGCSNLTTVTFMGDIKEFGGYAFSGCGNLTTLNGVNDSLVKVGNGSFSSCSKLSSFYFSKNLESIGVTAFYGCSELAGDIVLPETVKTLGYRTFTDCVKITSFTGLGILTTDDLTYGVFQGCEALTTVTFGIVLEEIAAYTFKDCINLTTLNIPEKAPLKTIGTQAFLNCPISTFYFPDTLKTIGASAFENTGLSMVSIPTSVTSIGSGAFAGCKNLQGFDVSTDNRNYYAGGFGELYDALDTLICLPAGITGDANGSLELGENVLLAPYAFQGSILKSVVLPSAMSEIPEGLFEDSSIETIEIPMEVTSIGMYAFRNCASLRNVYFAGNKVTSIGSNAFNGCESLEEITLPNSVQTIAVSAFANSGLKSFVVPTGVTALYNNTFDHATSLRTVTLHNGITSIAQNVFNYTAIESITIPASVQQVSAADAMLVPISNENGAFQYCTSLHTVIFEGTIAKDLGAYLFQGCTSLRNVTLPSNTAVLPQGIFKGCTALETIAIPSTVTKIEQKAFLDSGLTQITLPEGLTTIENSAFENTKLVEIEIPSTVTTLGGGASSGGGIIILPRAALVRPGLGDETEEDGDAAYIFKNCKQLTTVVFKGVPTTKMLNGIFVGCTALTSVTLADGWTKFADNMFEGCTSLTNFVIPSTVTTMGSNVFKGWTATQKILCVAAEADVTFAAGWHGSATVEYGYVAPTV